MTAPNNVIEVVALPKNVVDPYSTESLNGLLAVLKIVDIVLATIEEQPDIPSMMIMYQSIPPELVIAMGIFLTDWLFAVTKTPLDGVDDKTLKTVTRGFRSLLDRLDTMMYHLHLDLRALAETWVPKPLEEVTTEGFDLSQLGDSLRNPTVKA